MQWVNGMRVKIEREREMEYDGGDEEDNYGGLESDNHT